MVSLCRVLSVVAGKQNPIKTCVCTPAMDVVDWLSQYGLFLFLGGDLLLFLVSILLWKPGTRMIASTLFVFALIPPLAVFAELLAPSE